jgi:hypothetical protein
MKSERARGKVKKANVTTNSSQTRILFEPPVHANQGHNPALDMRPQRDREGEREHVSIRRERGAETGCRSGALHRLPLLLPGDEQGQDLQVRWLQLFHVPRFISGDSVKSVCAADVYKNPSRHMISD